MNTRRQQRPNNGICSPACFSCGAFFCRFNLSGLTHDQKVQSKQPLKAFRSAASSKFLPINTSLLILFSSGSHGFAGHPSSIECTPYKFRSKAIRKEIFCVNKKLTASPKTKLKLRDVSFQIHSGKWKKNRSAT